VERIDSRHWSQRWLRCAQVGTDAVVMYDLYQAIDIRGCGRGKCTDLSRDGSTNGRRDRVMRFWNMDTCPSCGRPYDYASADQTLYLGHSLQEAIEAFELGEASLFGYGDAQPA